MTKLSQPLRRAPPTTPDGRYIVVRGRLWRAANPHLAEPVRQRLVDALMAARRAVAAARRAADPDGETAAHAAVDRAKQALGERGPVWWHDGAADLNRQRVHNTAYAAWFAELCAPERNPTGPGAVGPVNVCGTEGDAMTDPMPNPKLDDHPGSNTEKAPDNWVSGKDPMTGAQASYLATLSEEAGEALPPEDLSKAEASKRIDALKAKLDLA